MAALDTLDVIILGVILIATLAYFTKGSLWGGGLKDAYGRSIGKEEAVQDAGSRCIVKKMEELDKNCIVLYGSQTGTAEDYALRLGKEAKTRFGLKSMTADLEDYDYSNLDTLPEDKILILVLSTYGEGEPTDNAAEFYEFIMDESVSFSGANDPPLSNLKYVAFGLGNNTYEHFNAMVRRIDATLQKLGATRISTAGEGDDGTGTMEDDFLAWKEPMWAAVNESMSLEEREAVFEPNFAIIEKDDLTVDSPEVYLGEPNKNHKNEQPRGPFNTHNPFIANVTESRELYASKARNCLHLEVDISGSNMTYQTGDHIAVWPTNAGHEVDRFLSILDLTQKRDQVISVEAIDPTAKVPFPTPTTYDAIVRYRMDICAPVSRQRMASLAAWAPDDEIKAEMVKLGSDKDYFHEKVSKYHFNMARTLEIFGKGKKWTRIPFAALVEGVNHLQPRYYSISSSSLVQPSKVSITAIVDTARIEGREDPFRGVATNYLLALKHNQNGELETDQFCKSYQIAGPRGKYGGTHMPVHIRHSNFKLPSDTSKPVIMIGPGTGVAPFRGFLQERAKQASEGVEVGKMVLYFGCRKRSDDFMYEDEFDEYKKILGDKFELITAFSRETDKKVYVQHRLAETAKEVNALLEQKGYLYVCGDAAHMAREVNAGLVQLIADQRGVSEEKAESVVKQMRNMNHYQEDVWS